MQRAMRHPLQLLSSHIMIKAMVLHLAQAVTMCTPRPRRSQLMAVVSCPVHQHLD